MRRTPDTSLGSLVQPRWSPLMSLPPSDRGPRRGDVYRGLMESAAAREGGAVLDERHPDMSREVADAQPRPGRHRLAVDHHCRPASQIQRVHDLAETGRRRRGTAEGADADQGWYAVLCQSLAQRAGV